MAPRRIVTGYLTGFTGSEIWDLVDEINKDAEPAWEVVRWRLREPVPDGSHVVYVWDYSDSNFFLESLKNASAARIVVVVQGKEDMRQIEELAEGADVPIESYLRIPSIRDAGHNAAMKELEDILNIPLHSPMIKSALKQRARLEDVIALARLLDSMQ